MLSWLCCLKDVFSMVVLAYCLTEVGILINIFKDIWKTSLATFLEKTKLCLVPVAWSANDLRQGLLFLLYKDTSEICNYKNKLWDKALALRINGAPHFSLLLCEGVASLGNLLVPLKVNAGRTNPHPYSPLSVPERRKPHPPLRISFLGWGGC